MTVRLNLIHNQRTLAGSQRRGMKSVARWLILVPLLTLSSSLVPAQELLSVSDIPDVTLSPDEMLEDELEGAAGDDLDKLLELAESDVASLTRVKVTAPSLDVEVTTVSRQKSTVGQSPAAVFVITQDMIRRSGATRIPEVLRMAPGVQVARLDSSKWAISIRGFNNRFANKLLVQIDGRSVYTPLFAGVFWEIVDYPLADIERIEVIRGPGATVWGANAVNGVINIITKKSSETQGYRLETAVGNEDRGRAMGRVGGRISENATYRVYGKWYDRDSGFAPNNGAHDDWRMAQTGFRTDWEPSCCDLITLQGDYYDGYTGQRMLFATPTAPPFSRVSDNEFHVAGGNVLWRWNHEISDQSDWSAQLYYDRTERAILRESFLDERDTFDFDFQHKFQPLDNHTIIWGFGYRFMEDATTPAPPVFALTPLSRADDLFSYFVQDEITLREDELFFTVGSKFQHNDYTGFEIQPTARILMRPTEQRVVWAAVSRAVRTPSRAEEDVTFTFLPTSLAPPTFPVFSGNRNLQSEELIAYELGFRAQPTEFFSWDLALFYHEYDKLVTNAVGTPVFSPFPFPTVTVPIQVVNGPGGNAYGFELASTYDVTSAFRLHGSYSLLLLDFGGSSTEGRSPRNQAYLQASWDLTSRVNFDLIGRYVDHLPAEGVPSYLTADARLAYWLTPRMELAVVGRQLLDASQPEFGMDTTTGTLSTEVEREVYFSVAWER